MINKSHSSLSGREAAAGASGVFRGWKFASFLFGAFSFLVGIAALPLRLILRDNIGERSIQPMSLLLAVAVHVYYFTQFDAIIALLAVIGVDRSAFNSIGTEGFLYFAIFVFFNPYSLFLMWAIVRGIKHFRQKIREAQRGETGYTYYRGDSRFFADWPKPIVNGFETNPDTIRMLVEPKSVFVIGLAVAMLSGVTLLLLIFKIETDSIFLTATVATLLATGLVIALDAICLAIDEVSLSLTRRDKVLDILDSEEDAKTIMNQKEVMKGLRNKSNLQADSSDETEEFVVQ